MIKITPLCKIPKDKRYEVQVLADCCVADEKMRNIGKLCWFISDGFYRRNRNAQAIVYETKNNGIVGIALLHISRKKGVATLTHLFVKRRYRRMGIASKIIATARKIAKTDKMALTLRVNPLNEPAMKLFGNLGFLPKPNQFVEMKIRNDTIRKGKCNG